MFIYKITNLIDGKIYVGKTVLSIEQRLNGHISRSNNPESTSHLHLAMKKYGIDNFKIEEIDTADSEEELNEKEKYWIAKLNARDKDIGYNISAGGDGVSGCDPWNKGLTKETDERLVQSQETIDKRSNSLSKAHAEGKFNYEEIFTEEVRAKMSEKAKQREHPATTDGRFGYTNGKEYKVIEPKDIPFYESLGWWHGQPEAYKGKEPPNKGKKGMQVSEKKGKITIHYPGLPEIKNKFIPISEYEFYYTQGWIRGSRIFKNCIL